ERVGEALDRRLAATARGCQCILLVSWSAEHGDVESEVPRPIVVECAHIHLRRRARAVHIGDTCKADEDADGSDDLRAVHQVAGEGELVLAALERKFATRRRWA